MKVAREGYMFIGLAAFAAGATIARAAAHPSTPRIALAMVLFVLAVWVVAFFRDPERDGERGPSVVIAPADGRVVFVGPVDEPAFIGGTATRVSIFMSVFNVHVNRYPITGTVLYAHYNRGRFMSAARDKASLENEQMSLGIAGGPGVPSDPSPGPSADRRVLVRQIAGLIARRIVTYGGVGDAVAQGERLGLIRFGSRVDVFLPPDARIAVAVGDRTAAGMTVVARWTEAAR